MDELIAGVEEEGGFGVDEGGAGNAGKDDAVAWGVSGLEEAADEAFLEPDLAGGEFAIGGEAGEFGAGASAAGGAVIGFAGAEDEVAAIGAREGGRAEDFDVIDVAVVFSGDAVSFEGLADFPGVISQLVEVFEFDGAGVIGGEKEPITAPGDISGDLAVTGNLQGDLGCMAITGDVIDSYSAFLM